MPSKKVAARYAKSPGIKPKPTASDGPVTAATPSSETPGAAPQASPTSGTDGIQVTERHATERQAMFDGHQSELKDMHKRHIKAFDEMGARHMAEIGGAPAEKG